MSNSVSDVPEYIFDNIAEIAKNEGFTTYTTDVEPGSKNGDNFLGVIIRVVLKGQRKIEQNATVEDKLNLICKLVPANANRRKQFNLDELYEREVFFYTKLVPVFVEFQKEKGLTEANGFWAIPRVFKAFVDQPNDHFVLILEDLREMGFALWPKNDHLRLDHLDVLFREIAKFHAISFALKDQQPDVFERFKTLRDLCGPFFKDNGCILTGALDRVLDVLTNEKHKEAVRRAREEYGEWFLEIFNADSFEPFGVAGHGDLWMTNFMFQHLDGVSEIAFFNGQCLPSLLIDQSTRHWSPCDRLASPAIFFTGHRPASRLVHSHRKRLP